MSYFFSAVRCRRIMFQLRIRALWKMVVWSTGKICCYGLFYLLILKLQSENQTHYQYLNLIPISHGVINCSQVSPFTLTKHNTDVQSVLRPMFDQYFILSGTDAIVAGLTENTISEQELLASRVKHCRFRSRSVYNGF